MDKRGQILSLDYVISLILVLLALGLLLNFFELQTVNAKEAQLGSELEMLVDGAARLALTSPDIACRLESLDGSKDIGVLPNCIPNTSGRLTKQNIGMPGGFECAIVTDPPGVFSGTGCQDTFPNGTDYYSATRKIVVKTGGDPKVTKKQLQDCAESLGPCALTDANITISIWRT